MSPAAASTQADATPLLMAAGLAKAYGETRALRTCNLTVRRGSVHAVIGENGSGKSTLVKILTGVVKSDAGTLSITGLSDARFASPRDARRAGIATTFQEILVLEDLSVLDNLWLGQDGLFRAYVATDRRHAAADAILHELLGDIIPGLATKIADLDLGTRQAIVIARSLLTDPRLLILDEATAALDIQVRDRLFASLRKRVAEGLSVLFITHKMDEIASLSDEVTVLRSGESVATLPTHDATPARMLQLMSGRADTIAAPPIASEATRPILTVERAAIARGALPFDMAVRPGEILGLAGLEGHGADLFAQILGGVRSPLVGRIVDASGTAIRGQSEFVRSGIAYVPRDRKREGIFAPLSIADNFSIATLRRHARFGVLDDKQIARTRQPLFDRLGVKYGKLSHAITSLSGGNQQKVILARTLALAPKLLVLNDPTRGVDLATKQDIYSLLAEQAAAGIAVVIHSTEIEELLALCQRIAIFHDASLFRVLDRGDLNREAVIAGLFGQMP